MFKRTLLIPGETVDEPAAERASQICKSQRGGEIFLFEAVYEPHLEGYLGHAEIYENLRRKMVDEQAERLERLASEFRRRNCRCTARAVWAKPSHGTVIEHAQQARCELIVQAASRAHGGLSRSEWMLASHAPVPVLFVKSTDARPYRRVLAAVDPYQARGKPRSLDLRILAAAEAVCSASGAELRIVHCFTPVAEIARNGYADWPVDRAERVLETARRHALEALIEESGIGEHRSEIVSGKPGAVLVHAAEARETDLIVLGAVSRGPLRELFLGSTAEQVLDEAPCDVLVIASDDRGEARKTV